MGRHETGRLHRLHRIEGAEPCVEIVDERNPVLGEHRAARDAVSQKHRAVRRAESGHVERMAGQRNRLELPRKCRVAECRNVARLRQQEFVPQLRGRTASVQERRLEERVARERPLDPGSKNAAAGAFLQKPVSADMVRVRMGVDDRPQTPPFSFQNPERPFAGVPVVAAVDQADVRPVQQADADLRRTIDIPAAFSGANQFIHRAFPPVFHQYTPAAPEKQGTRLAPEPQRAYIEP